MMDVFTLRIPDEDRLSDDELFRICSANKELRIERDEEGQLIIMSPAGSVSSNKNFILNSIFGAWVESHSLFGYGFDSSGGLFYQTDQCALLMQPVLRRNDGKR